MTATDASAPRLLVVNEDPAQAQVIRDLLRSAPRPWEVEGLESVEGLAGQLRSGRYEVCLLAHRLRGMTADQVLQLLPPAPERPPVVVLTDACDPRLIDTYLTLGVADLLNRDDLRPAVLDRTLRFAVAQWRSQRAIERSQQDLLRSERLATVGRMASGVAHEYNNLNAIVLTGLERLHQRIDGDAQAHELVQRILGAVERSRRISESLLTLGRSSESAGTVIDVASHLADAIALLELRARRFGARLVLTNRASSAQVRIDITDLHQVLSNLVVNALHAVHRACDPVVGVLLESRGETVEIQVQDNGVGIEPEDMSKLFHPFFSRKGAHDRCGRFPASVNGVGLGLPVCQMLVDRAGGDLRVTSQPGVGTTVTVVLPLAREPLRALSAPPSPAPPPSPVKPPARRRLVVVDDNTMLCQMLHDALGEAGFPVHSYVEPARFLAEHPRDEIDLLMLDWQMPVLTGRDVLQQLGDPTRTTPLRVLVVSGEPPVLPSPLPPGIHLEGVVMKPFRLSELIERLSTTC